MLCGVQRGGGTVVHWDSFTAAPSMFHLKMEAFWSLAVSAYSMCLLLVSRGWDPEEGRSSFSLSMVNPSLSLSLYGESLSLSLYDESLSLSLYGESLSLSLSMVNPSLFLSLSL